MRVSVKGHITITDVTEPDNHFILVDKDNSINYENMSEAIADTLSDRGYGYIYQMAFGNGASSIDETGVITYLPPNTTGPNAFVSLGTPSSLNIRYESAPAGAVPPGTT